MRNFLLLLLFIALTSSGRAQQAVIGVYPSDPAINAERANLDAVAIDPALPDGLRAIRQRQKELNQQEGTLIHYLDEGLRSLSSLQTIPIRIADVEVTDETSILSVVDQLYPYFGFSGTESLMYQSSVSLGQTKSYRFLEYINDIPTETIITIMVDEAISRIVRITGGATIDRGFSTVHIYNEQEAIEAVLDYVRNIEDRSPTLQNSDNYVRLLYRTLTQDRIALEPWWIVNLNRIGAYFVDPAGEVESALEGLH